MGGNLEISEKMNKGLVAPVFPKGLVSLGNSVWIIQDIVRFIGLYS